MGTTTSGVTSVMSNNNNVVDDNGNKVVKSEEGNMEEVWNILNINLPETDDSSIWADTQAVSPFLAAMSDPGSSLANSKIAKVGMDSAILGTEVHGILNKL